jgi:hypothetical protein
MFQAPFGREQANDLRNEERIALGLCMQLGHELPRRLRLSHNLGEQSDLLFAEPRKLDATRRRLATELGKR